MLSHFTGLSLNQQDPVLGNVANAQEIGRLQNLASWAMSSLWQAV